jgi:phenylalanyl-tRNA synthetase beta chain
MKIPLSWLKDYVDIVLTPEALVQRLTLAGLEVESLTRIGELWERDKIFVGQVLEVRRHPDADRLVLARVSYGAAQPLTVVTGAPNLYPYVGQDLSGGRGPKVAFAVAGAQHVDGHSEERRIVRLKPGKIRGIASEGMVMSEKELDLSDEHEGVIILPDDAPVGSPLVDYLGDAVLEFQIKGAFGYLQSVVGIAREVAALTGQTLRLPPGARPGDQTAQIATETDFARIVIDAPDLCLRYSAALMEGLQVGPSPYWMQQRLARAGMRPINNVVDVTNYVMLELGQPLHAFDYDLLRLRAAGGTAGRPTIIMRRAHPGERLTTLDGVERVLDPNMLLITDTSGAVAVAGIMGGANTEVQPATTRILLEAANFSFLSIRRTSQLLKLSSEAASRFGKQVDPELTTVALTRAGELLRQVAGGTTRPVYADVYPGKPARRCIDLDPEYVNRLLGATIAVPEQERILRALDFEVEEDGQNAHQGQAAQPAASAGRLPEVPVLHVGVPSYRLDVSIPADLVEEVGRIYGYDRLPATLLEAELPPQRRNLVLEGETKVRDVLTGCGVTEAITYSMIDPSDDARLLQGPVTLAYVKLLNPLTAERTHLRRLLLPSLLTTARANLRFRERVAIFELGRVFIPRPDHVLPAEPRRLAAVMVGPRDEAGWQPRDTTPLGFFDLKGIVETLLERLELRNTQWERGEHPGMHPGRTARLVVNGADAGAVGELHPLVRAAFDLPAMPVALMELDLDVLLRNWGEAATMSEISSQPAVYEDLAIIVDESVPAAQVAGLIRQTGGKTLVDLRLFDVYRGQPVPEGKKSLAYNLAFQAPDRTLTDQDVAKLRHKIVQRLERDLGAALRT